MCDSAILFYQSGLKFILIKGNELFTLAYFSNTSSEKIGLNHSRCEDEKPQPRWRSKIQDQIISGSREGN